MNLYLIEFDITDCVSLRYNTEPQDGRDALQIKANSEADALFYAGMVWLEQMVQGGFQIRYTSIHNMRATFMQVLEEGEE